MTALEILRDAAEQMRPLDPDCADALADMASEYADGQRPDDDPAPIPTCSGRDCGGRPHD